MLDNKNASILEELLGINKHIVGLVSQRDRHNIALKEVDKLIKKLKSSKNKKVSRIVGGNIIDEVDSKEAIHFLQERKREIEIGMKGLDEQIMHREDGLESAIIRAYRFIRIMTPEDVREEYESSD